MDLDGSGEALLAAYVPPVEPPPVPRVTDAPPLPPPAAVARQSPAPEPISAPAQIATRRKVNLATATRPAVPAGGAVVSEQPAIGRTLRLYLPRSESYEHDVALMQTVYSLLNSVNGDDRLTLYVPNGVGMVVMQSQQTIDFALLRPAIGKRFQNRPDQRGH
jgi:DNA polymerase-3 subunit alpha